MQTTCFWWKLFFFLYLINLSNFIVWLPSLREILRNMWIVGVYYPGCNVMNFEINFTFLIKLFFLHDFLYFFSPISQDKKFKKFNILRTKKAFKMRYKRFFIIFKGLQLKQIKNVFGRREFDFNCRKIKMEFVVPHLGWNRVLSVSTCCTIVSQ